MTPCQFGTDHLGRPFVLCGLHPPVYRYRGVLFEWGGYCGPIPLRKRDSEPKVRPTQHEWDVVTRWVNLPKREREKYRIDRP